MQNVYAICSNTVEQFELFYRRGYFYWPRSITSKTEYQRDTLRYPLEPEAVGDLVYIVAGSDIKNGLQNTDLAGKFYTSPMITHWGTVDRIYPYPVLAYRFSPKTQYSYAAGETTYDLPFDALPALLETSMYQGRLLTDAHKEEIRNAQRIYDLILSMAGANQLHFEDVYVDGLGLFTRDSSRNNYYSLLSERVDETIAIAEYSILPQSAKKLKNRLFYSRDTYEKLFRFCVTEGIDPMLLINISTWHGSEHYRVKLVGEVLRPMGVKKLDRKVSTRLIFEEDTSSTFLNDLKEKVRDLQPTILEAHKMSEAKNLIYYGPPGTGKTYQVIEKAVELADPQGYQSMVRNDTFRQTVVERYKELLDANRICFCTFHQSYSYEDFVEGLRSDEAGRFVPQDGIFKRLCKQITGSQSEEISTYHFDETSTNFFKMSLGRFNTEEENIFDFCLQNNCIALGWGGLVNYEDCDTREEVEEAYQQQTGTSSTTKDFNITAINCFKVSMQVGDIVLISQGNSSVRAIAKVTGDYYYDNVADIEYHHFRSVEWLYQGDPIDVGQFLNNKKFSQQAIYSLNRVDIKIDHIKRLLTHTPTPADEKYVLIIDEINRGNISKIFGELITLIEEDKRLGAENELKVTLPYSQGEFGVPANIFLIGTMNTADRSISLMDTALRRRFRFYEVMSEPQLLLEDVEGINVRKFLSSLNERIEFLYDRDHTIGHAYFMKENLTFDALVEIMQTKVIPLLQEYFYEDWERIELVLGGAGEPGDQSHFLTKVQKDPAAIFPGSRNSDLGTRSTYSVVSNPNKQAFLNLT